MGLLNLVTGKKQMVQRISNFEFSRNGKFLAITLAPERESKEKGFVLLVKNLMDSTTRTIGNVTEYAFNKKSDRLAYIVEAANSAGNTVELFNFTDNSIKVLASDTTKFSKLTWQKEGDGLAFYRSFRKNGFEEDNALIYAYTDIYKKPVLQKFDPETAMGFPKDMRIFAGSRLSISDDMTTTFFGIRKWTANPLAKKDDKKPGDTLTKKDSIRIDSTRALAKKGSSDKLAQVDVWHWKDAEIQPRQRLTFGADTVLSYLSGWNLDKNTFFQYAKEIAPNAQISGNQKYVLISTNKKYRPAFKEDFSDAYLVNVKTGEEKLVFEKAIESSGTFPSSSPDGKYFLYFKDKNWWTYNIATGENVNITEQIKTNFWDVRDDHPLATRPPVGSGGWLKGDKAVLLYDEYDTWSVSPDGSSSRKMTSGAQDEIMFRIFRTDRENQYIDDSKPIYFAAMGDKTKHFGYYRFDKEKFEKLIYEDVQVGALSKAKDADVFTYTKQDFDKSPSLFITDNFKAETEIAKTNLQQANYYLGQKRTRQLYQ